MSQYTSMNYIIHQDVASLAPTVIYEQTGSQIAYLDRVIITNVSGSDQTFTFGVARGQDAINQDKQMFYTNQDLPAGNPMAFALKLGLKSGDRVFFYGSSTQIAINMMGVVEQNKQ